MTRLKNTRTVTYRKAGIPAVILEGKWLERNYGWRIGDQISVEYQPNEIRLRNVDKELANDLGLKTKKELPEGSPRELNA